MFYWQTDRRISLQDMKRLFLERREIFRPDTAKAAIEYGLSKSGRFADNVKVLTVTDPINRGSVNNVVKARLVDGKSVMARFHPTGVRNGYFWAESLASRMAKAAGVPAFETYYIHDTRKKFPFDYMVTEALPGKTMQDYWPLSPQLERKLVFETGKYAALIHNIKVSGFGFFSNNLAKQKRILQGQYPNFSNHFYAAFEDNLKFLVDNGVLGPDIAKSVEKVLTGHEDLLACSRPVLVHNDIADWNQLSDGKKVTGMVDWDECFGGDPVMDFAQWSLFFDDERLKFFIEGYKSISQLPEGYKEKEHLFRLRYTVSKLHLRKKRLLATDSEFMKRNLARGLQVLAEEMKIFDL